MEINLPDGSVKELEKGSNGLDLAKSIGAGLAKSAVAVVVNGEPVSYTHLTLPTIDRV